MAKLNIVPAIILNPFRLALGDVFQKVCNDCKAFLGRVEKDINTTGGEWKCSAKGVLSSKDGNKVNLPLNNPMSTLVAFGMQLTDVAQRAGFGGEFKLTKDGQAFDNEEESGIQAQLPKICQAWVDQMVKEVKEEKQVT